MANDNSITSQCGTCLGKVTQRDKGICCDKCQKWYHTNCQQMSLELYGVLKKHQDEMWFCNRCKVEVKESIIKIKELEEKNKRLEEKVKALEEKWENIKDELVQETTSQVMRSVQLEIKKVHS